MSLEARPLVLVVTPDPAIAGQLRAGLGTLRCDVVAVSSVIDAIAELHGVEFDLAIVAIALPPRSGLDVVRVARELSPDTEVIVLLQPNERDAAIDCVRAGAFDFLGQPLCPDELGAVVERAIARRRERGRTAMFQASHAILTGTDPKHLPSLMVRLSAELLSADNVTLYRCDRGGGLFVGHSYGCSKEHGEMLEIAKAVMASQTTTQPILFPEDIPGAAARFPQSRIHSAILCPMTIDGRLSAVFVAQRSNEPRPYRRSIDDRGRGLRSV